MKLQFIIVGWHFDNFPELIDQLIELDKENDIIDIFWTCHKEPSFSLCSTSKSDIAVNNFGSQLTNLLSL